MAAITIDSFYIYLLLFILGFGILFIWIFSFFRSSRFQKWQKQRQTMKAEKKIIPRKEPPKKQEVPEQDKWLIDDEKETPYKPFVYWRPKWTWDIRVWINPLVWVKVIKWRRWRKKALHRVCVNMQISPNEAIQFMMNLRADNSFTWLKGRYVCDPKTARYNMSAKMDEYFFHKDLSISLKYDTNYKEVLEASKKAMNEDGLPEIEVYHNLDPRSLQLWVEAEATKVALQANALGQFLKRLFAVTVITLFLVVLFMVIYGFGSGLFQQIQG